MKKNPQPSSQMNKLHTIAGKLSRGEFKNVVVLTGAGVSVAAGIPDFRSPGGMYQTLRPELLTATEAQRESMRDDPSQVVSWDIFSQNQLPYLELRRSFILDIAQNRWKPTLSHYFIRVLHDNGVLRRLYTQNIDGLDNQVGLAQDKMVQLHGTLANISCEFCSAPYPSDEFRKQVQQRIKDITGIDRSAPATSSTIPCGECGSLRSIASVNILQLHKTGFSKKRGLADCRRHQLDSCTCQLTTNDGFASVLSRGDQPRSRGGGLWPRLRRPN
eukprot:c10154_g1_i2.p1 GENE.c10154_g1_i2~~c10154_g1_i2.p1  ORF type:complete len:294 (+),score=59.26 c10154_g1_i2:64-882(+)